MTNRVAVRRRPEEEELARKEAELAQLKTELAERELHLANTQAELSAFEGTYLRTVGILYAELDELHAQIAERAARVSNTQEATHSADEARHRAQESHSAAISESANAKEFTPSKELKALYREAAKRIHPDLALDESDRRIRERLMADANRAYEYGDEQRLREIIAEYDDSPDSVKGEDVGSQLIRVIRRINQGRKRLSEIESEIENLAKSELCALFMKAREAEQAGRNLLSEMATNVQKQIALARQRLVKP